MLRGVPRKGHKCSAVRTRFKIQRFVEKEPKINTKLYVFVIKVVFRKEKKNLYGLRGKKEVGTSTIKDYGDAMRCAVHRPQTLMERFENASPFPIHFHVI